MLEDKIDFAKSASMHSDQMLIEMGKKVIEIERDAMTDLANRINGDFARACHYILQCKGRTVVTGMGKSGHIGHKIAATLASTGSPSFFMHPGEASHGDLGMITRDDVVLAISNSGTTDELLTILPGIKRFGLPLIVMAGDPNSILAREASVYLNIGVNQEACPLGLAPTASTTVALAMGDALAIALLDAKGFTPDDFALTHPAGQLGRKILLKVEALMHKNERIPTVLYTASISEALVEMTRKRLGMTAIVDEQQQLMGVYTDGDLRRTIDKNYNLQQTTIAEVMSVGCKTILPTALAATALNIMENHKITSLIVSEDQKNILGVIHLHDLLQAGVA